MKPHTAGIVAALVTIAGTLLELIPIVQGNVPPKYAWVVTVLGIICQAVTKGVQHGGTDLVPKETNGAA